MGKVLGQCKSLDADALTATLPIGPGSLLATLKHMAAAEQVWLDRWLLKPNPSMHDMPNSIDELESVFASLARDRTILLESDPNALSKSISYRNMKGEPDEQKLIDIVGAHFSSKISKDAQKLIGDYLQKRGASALATDQLLNAVHMLHDSGQTFSTDDEKRLLATLFKALG